MSEIYGKTESFRNLLAKLCGLIFYLNIQLKLSCGLRKTFCNPLLCDYEKGNNEKKT